MARDAIRVSGFARNNLFHNDGFIVFSSRLTSVAIRCLFYGLTDGFGVLLYANTVDAAFAGRALAVAASSSTNTRDAGLPVGTGHVVVDQSVAVVILSVTRFLFRSWSAATSPLPILANFFPLTADSPASSLQVLIRLTVAIVVFSVAHFRFGLVNGAPTPLAVLA